MQRVSFCDGEGCIQDKGEKISRNTSNRFSKHKWIYLRAEFGIVRINKKEYATKQEWLIEWSAQSTNIWLSFYKEWEIVWNRIILI